MATAHDVHALAHTARMLAVLAERADHPRLGEYTAQIGIYRARWGVLSPDDRAAVVDAATGLPDMSEARVSAAVAALEG